MKDWLIDIALGGAMLYVYATFGHGMSFWAFLAICAINFEIGWREAERKLSKK